MDCNLTATMSESMEVVQLDKNNSNTTNNDNNDNNNNRGNNAPSESDTINDFLGVLSEDEEDDQQGTPSYADAARGDSGSEQNNDSRKDRTFTFFNLMTSVDITESIIDALSRVFKESPSDLFEKV